MLRVVIARVLQHDQGVVLLWGDHDLVLLRADPNELDVIFGVKWLQSALSLGSELSDERPVLDGVVLAHSGADGDAARVHHDDALDTLVRVDAINGLLNFLGLYTEVSYFMWMLTIYIILNLIILFKHQIHQEIITASEDLWNPLQSDFLQKISKIAL